MTSSTPDGLDLAALDRHLCAGGIARSGAPRAELIVGGRSNLTFLVSEDTSKWVLGWPPLHGLTPSAHEMVRDYRVVAALYDSSVSGCPQGHHARRRLRAGMRRARWSSTFLGGWSAARGSCRRSATRKSSTAASMRSSEYWPTCTRSTRQPLAWPISAGQWLSGPSGSAMGSQWQHLRLPDDARDADVRRLYTRLVQSFPQQRRVSIVHGDYRIDNTILDSADANRVRAVLDWELSTLGDPLSDAALMCAYRDSQFDLLVDLNAAWTSPLLPAADALAHRYLVASEQPLAHWDIYMALAYFKSASIAAGIDFRRRMRGSDDDADLARQAVAPLIVAGLSKTKT